MTKIMGILNATPDSFYENCRAATLDAAIERGLQIEKEGADIIDVGGESTRPRNIYLNPDDKPVTEAEEIQRVIPLIKELKKLVSIPISIDTRKVKVAEAAIKEGACWINDVSGFQDPQMRALAAESKATLCCMHMQGLPETMQIKPAYEGDITESIKQWFLDTLDKMLDAGIKKEQIVFDPGIGFGKTIAHNLEIIHNLNEFKELGFPVLLGISRKMFMAKLLNKPTTDLLAATLTMNMIAISSKVDYIRVHDVAAHRDMLNLLNAYAEC